MVYRNFFTLIKEFYHVMRYPLWGMVITLLLYAFHLPLLKLLLQSPRFNFSLIISIFDFVLITFIFVFSVSLALKTINFIINALYSYRQKHKAFALTLPLIENGTKFLVFLWLLYLFVPYFNFPIRYEEILAKCFNVVTIIVITVIIIRSIIAYEKLISSFYSHDLNNLKARQIYTQMHLLRKILITIVIILALASIFMVFENMREVGVSLLASAGVISAIIGFAAQKSLGNITACLQLAFTRIIKIGDEVIIDNETGRIEEITLTYIIIKLWDLRRLIIPVNYLNEKPFQNLTRSSSELLGVVFLYVDYAFPIEEARKIFKQIIEQSKEWNKKTAALHVSNASNNAMELRLLVSADSNAKLWNLRCEVREKMIDYIATHHPNALPKLRTETQAFVATPP